MRTDEPPVERDGVVLVPASTLDLDDPAWPFVPDADGVVRGATDHGLVPLVPYATVGEPRPVDDAGLDAGRPLTGSRVGP